MKALGNWLGNVATGGFGYGAMVLAGAPGWGRWAVAVLVFAIFQAADFVVARVGGAR